MTPSAEESYKGKWMALLAAFLGWMFDGFEMALFPLAGRPALRELMNAVGPEGDKLIGLWFSVIIACFLVGAAVGGVLFGWMGDRIGRVKAMVWCVLTYSVFSGLCTFVQTPWQLGVLRFIASLGMGGEWALGVALVAEIWPSTSRPLLAGLIGAAANVGFLLVGLIGLGLNKFVGSIGSALNTFLPDLLVESLLKNNGWRILFLVGSIPALLTFLIRLFVPESEKWKKASQQFPKPRVSDIFKSGLARYTLLGAVLAGMALLGTWGSVQWVPAWTGQMTRNDGGKVAWTQIFMAVGAITIAIVAPLLAQKFNRRTVYFLMCIVSLAVCEMLFLWKPAFGFHFLLLATLANGITAGFYGWLPLYLPELFPTRVRATGSGFCFNIGRIFAAAGALGGGALHQKVFNGDYAAMCSVICLIYAAGMVVIWFCPETKGNPLPE